MQAIERSLSAVSVGAVQRHRNLAVFPLISGEGAAPGYTMLDEALGSGRAFVTELTESGSVPELAFEWQPGQAGAVFAIDGHPVAVELFDSPDTFRKFLKKAVGSFAMDAVAAQRPVEKAPTKKKVEAFLGIVKAAPLERFPAAGEGEDLRLSGDGLAGGALEAQGRVVHLSVFRIDA